MSEIIDTYDFWVTAKRPSMFVRGWIDKASPEHRNRFSGDAHRYGKSPDEHYDIRVLGRDGRPWYGHTSHFRPAFDLITTQHAFMMEAEVLAQGQLDWIRTEHGQKARASDGRTWERDDPDRTHLALQIITALGGGGR